MTRVVYGERVGKHGELLFGCSASVFDASGKRMLLTRRADNGRWCVPGGRMEPGESVVETCVREVREETGFDVRVVRLLTVYSSPHMLIEHLSGNRWQLVVLHFLAEVVGGEGGVSEETTEVRYFSQSEIDALDVVEFERQRIWDGFELQETVVLR